MFLKPYDRRLGPGHAGRLQQSASCSLSTSRAADADDTTSMCVAPRRSSITGPCRRASSRRLRCGSEPSWCRLPSTGSRAGPGGSLSPFLPLATRTRTGSRRPRPRRSCCHCWGSWT
uniref:Uncharacterized protein n=1 Tax=Triticum urartu TaxID=4572 RepID=A0A8R7R2R7_TRIUA